MENATFVPVPGGSCKLHERVELSGNKSSNSSSIVARLGPSQAQIPRRGQWQGEMALTLFRQPQKLLSTVSS